MRFDWYAATVPQEPQTVLSTLVSAADLADLRPARPMHGYTHGAEVARGDRVLVRALYGGPNGPDTHIWASGEDTEWFVDQVRRNWPVHRVTRLDSAEDFTAPHAWESLSHLALEVADRFNIDVKHQGDFHRGEKGRTIYLGSRHSPTQMLVYEKGKQLGGDPLWVRCEARVKPKRVGREMMSACTPLDVWACTAYLRAIGERLSHQDLQAIRIGSIYRPPDDARAWSALARQYGRILREKATVLGGWAELGAYLGERVTDTNITVGYTQTPNIKH
jgi:hypothetical protein